MKGNRLRRKEYLLAWLRKRGVNLIRPKSKEIAEQVAKLVGIEISGATTRQALWRCYRAVRGKSVRATVKAKRSIPAFYASYEWRKLRYQVIKDQGQRCKLCGRTPADGITINVDHIRPLKHNPELALEITNLQVLCHECNHGKANWDDTDWRTAP